MPTYRVFTYFNTILNRVMVTVTTKFNGTRITDRTYVQDDLGVFTTLDAVTAYFPQYPGLIRHLDRTGIPIYQQTPPRFL